MILTRLGNKRRLASELIKHFPQHNMRIELFFGAGGSYFYLPKPKYAIVNDFDDDIANLYFVIQNKREEFEKQIQMVPISEGVLKYWKQNLESNPIRKAVRFVFISNFTYMGKGDTLRLGLDNAKKSIIQNIEKTFLFIQNVKIMNKDFRDVLPSISFSKGLNDKEKAFVYLDPIYFETEHFYKVPKWNFKDSLDCLEIVKNCGIKAAMSEFNHPKIVNAAKDLGLIVEPIKERSNIKNRRIEILIKNYNTTTLF